MRVKCKPFLNILVVLFFLAPIVLTSDTKVSAGVQLPENCSIRLFNRCMNEGYFTGSPSNTSGDTAALFPLPASYSYSDNPFVVGAAASPWSFPAVPGCRNQDQSDCTTNSGYATTFINIMSSYINGNYACSQFPLNAHDACGQTRVRALGAAMIIDTMLGRWGTDYGNWNWGDPIANYFPVVGAGIGYARSNFNTWANLVRAYDNAGQVHWSAFQIYNSGHYNSTGMNYGTDDEFFINTDTTIGQFISFNNSSGQPLYTINRACGNIVGALQLPPPPPPLPTVDIRVNGSDTPAAIAVGGGITVSWTSTNATSCRSSGGTWGTNQNKTPVASGSEARPLDDDSPGVKTYSIICTGPGGSGTDTVQITVNPPPSVTLTVNGSTTPNPIEIGENITVVWTTNSVTSCTASGTWSGSKAAGGGTEQRGGATGADDNTTGTKTYNLSCSGPGGSISAPPVTIQVVTKPYLQVFSGDISAGNGFESLSNFCASDAGVIKAFNKGLPGGWAGAGSQLGVMAKGSISEFTSAALRASRPNGLSFATGAANTYGGNYGTAPACVDDYWSNKEDSTVQTPAVGTSYNVLTGIVTPGNFSGKQVIYVDGDAIINGSIIYANSTSWDLNSIPSFWLIVKGNIFISNNVTQLDGVYMALPRDATTGGTIYTCYQAINMASPITANVSGMASNCNNPLTIYGGFVAKQVKFLRSYGSLRDSTTGENPFSANKACSSIPASSSPICAAERFIYSPEAWLVAPSLTGNTDAGDYDSITSLPPVL